MKHLLITPDRNTSGSDFTGAFKPEAERYAKFYTDLGDVTVTRRIDVSQHSHTKRAQLLSVIKNEGPFDRLVLFCHGWHTGIQFGLNCGNADEIAQLAEFAKAVVAASTVELKVALYACSTGASDNDSPVGDGSFADLLRDDLCGCGRPNASVFGHTSAGHTTRNANVRMFYGTGTLGGGTGGVDIAPHGTPEGRRLYDRLHDGNDTLRWRLPYMTLEQARAELK